MDPNNTMAGTPGEQNNNAVPETAVSETMVSETATSAASGSAPSEAAVEMQAAMVADQIANPVEPPKENIMAEGNAAKKKSGKGMMIAVALLALVALGGIGFGVWAMMDGNSQTKTLNDQISSLKKTNNELMEQLSEANANANANDGEDTIINIDTNDDYSNPVIISGVADSSYVISFNSTAIGSITNGDSRSFHVEVENGAVKSCNISYANTNEGGIADICEITGLNGKIYKVIEFGRGQDKSMNKIGFIMTDGSVQYLSLQDAIDGKNYSIQGSLKIDGFITDAVRIQDVNPNTNLGSGFSTIFILRDGKFVEFNESML